MPPKAALVDVSFADLRGKIFGLIGPNGAGKTTLFNSILGLVMKTGGKVDIWRFDIGEHPRNTKRAIGVVPQDTVLFNDTIRYNIAYGRPGATQAEIEQAARAAQVHDFVLHLPEGYDTRVGERGLKLSGGEKQRVAIARTLLKDPRILILDEATSALDTVSERLIQRALEQLERGRTTIAIAHRLSTILRADQILVYDRGTIVERGTHAELLLRGGLYARLYREQFEVAEADATARTAPVAGAA